MQTGQVMNLITYTILCYSVLGCGQAFTGLEAVPLGTKGDAQSPDSQEMAIEAAAPLQEARLQADGGEDAPEVSLLPEAGERDAAEEKQECMTGAYGCVGETSLYCDNGVWNMTIVCGNGTSCVADSRSCVE